MSENRKPDFTNRQAGISIWNNTDKNKKPYLSVKIELLDKYFNCFLNEDKSTLDKAKDVVNQSEPAAVVTEEKVE